MSDELPGDAIALMLSSVWHLHKSESFTTYLAETCARQVSGQTSFDCIYIVQAEDGEIPTGILRSAVKWWQVDDTGFKHISRPSPLVDIFTPENTRADFYITPVIRFFSQGREILIGETYGPCLLSRKVGTIEVASGGRLVLSGVRVVLTYNML